MLSLQQALYDCVCPSQWGLNGFGWSPLPMSCARVFRCVYFFWWGGGGRQERLADIGLLVLQTTLCGLV